jgi:hypothetical protein
MDFKEIKNKEEWDKKIGAFKMAQFLQSWEWGEFQQRLNRKIWRIDFNGLYIQAIKMPLPFGRGYLYIPRINFELSQKIISDLKNLSEAEKCIFIRVEPIKQNVSDLGFKRVGNVQPSKTLLLDLTKSEEELLAEMHQKWRYNIRLASKKGVNVREGVREKDLDAFYDLIASTYNRKRLKIYKKEYYQKLLETFTGAKIYLAEYQGKILAANLVLFYGDTATYLHGGSSEEYKNLMAPHFLQWETIKITKAMSYRYYDFWGIDERRWPGLTRFKKGFGGFEVDYGGTFDLVINNPWYLAYKILKSLK